MPRDDTEEITQRCLTDNLPMQMIAPWQARVVHQTFANMPN
jgi:hypothetical protein